MFNTNQNNSERIVRLILSLLILPATFLIGSSNYSLILTVAGSILLFNSISGTCVIYKILNINTCNIN
jgi:hypothetical protein